jgi:glycosyltransferase involved in cell wall biosynthesis
MNGDSPLRVVQVSTFDVAGGAERVAYNLFTTFRNRGLSSKLAVGHKTLPDPDIVLMRGNWTRFWSMVQTRTLNPRLHTLTRKFARAGLVSQHWTNRQIGRDNFTNRSTWELPGKRFGSPEIIHCHNLHGGYFDLRALPDLSKKSGVLITMHDAWLLSGHCAHSLGCERWKIGCGHCPDLDIYPPIRYDATAANWRNKKRIFEKSRLWITAPSQWLLNKIPHSILSPAVQKMQVIPNGIDVTVFHPASKHDTRNLLNLPQNAAIILFAANGIKAGKFKDYQTLRETLVKLGSLETVNPILLLAVGENAPSEQIGNITLQFVPFQGDMNRMAAYYQASDIYLHAARADTFPNTVLEAQACGLPVVASNVGGIPEQVKDLRRFGIAEATGLLCPVGDSNRMADAVRVLLTNGETRNQLSIQARHHAEMNYSIEQQVDDYLTLYSEMITHIGRTPKM